MSSSIGVTFLGALQASLSVLLTIFYGVMAGQYNLLTQSSSEDISNFCVKMLLPALLITRVGSELHLDTVGRYGPVVGAHHPYINKMNDIQAPSLVGFY